MRWNNAKEGFALKRFVFACLLALVLLCAANACAQSFALPVNGAEVTVHTTDMEGEEWLFLPSFADASVFAETGLSVMQSSNVNTLFLFSDDPVSEGREYIDGSEKHQARTTGSMALVAPDGTVSHAGRLRQLRGRGNGTWDAEKKPYQFKLEDRADLLGIGQPARTWVLLAEVNDASMLRNRIALDLALEMGLEETSHSEYVDLYYDGEYRGLYLLAEKVEIGEHRVDEMDYDDLIEAWHQNAGLGDPSLLPEVQGENAFGHEIHYIDGLYDNSLVDAGAYLLEMEDEHFTLSDRCWFRMEDGSVIALKNPENASKAMVSHVSEQLAQARYALASGEDIEKWFDVDAFARTALLYELSYSDSGFHYSSTFFVLPAGQTRFRPGPVWDFDLTWGYYRTGVNAGGAGVKDESGWLTEFYRSPQFASRMKEIYLQEMLPLIENILLGETDGRWLKTFDHYNGQIAQARAMNAVRWPHTPFWRFEKDADTEQAVSRLRSFIAERSRWLSDAMGDEISLWAWAPYAYVEDDLTVRACPWDGARVESFELAQLEEATEEDYALWQLEVIVSPENGADFANASFAVCGTPVSAELLADGTARLCVSFEDPSYRPVDYYGEDIGLVYNPDVYAASYPEIAAEYEDDPEGLMDYFCDDGMYEDHMGNAFFRPSEVLEFHPEMMDMFGEDWQLYYWDFLYYGYDDGWLLKPGRGFVPEVEDLL